MIRVADIDEIFSSNTAIFIIWLSSYIFRHFLLFAGRDPHYVFHCISLHHALELALRECASEQLVGNLVHILELKVENLVGTEVDEAEVIERFQGFTKVLVLLCGDLLEIELLGRGTVDADGRAVEEGTGLGSGGLIHHGLIGLDLLLVDLRFSKLLVVGGKDLNSILSNHLNWIGLDRNWLSVHRIVNIFNRVFDNGFTRLDTHNVA